MPGLGHTFLTRVVTGTHRSPLTGSPGTRYITCQHQIYKGIRYSVHKLQIQWTNMLSDHPCDVPSSHLSVCFSPHWLGSRLPGSGWMDRGRGGTWCQEQGSSRWNVVAGKSINLFFDGTEQRSRHESAGAVCKILHLLKAVKPLKIHLQHISVKL